MKKRFRLIERLVPRYAWLPLASLLVFNFISYFIPKLLESKRTLHTLSTAFDNALPRVPVFIFIYVLAYLQWVVGYIIIARDCKERCYRIIAGDILAKLIAMTVFLIYPTTLNRPAAEGTGVTAWLMAAVYWADTPTNLFPSPHCMESWMCFRGAVGLKRVPRAYPWFQLVFTLLVFASVLLVKQHVWFDILGGVASAELGLLLGRALGADRIFTKLEQLQIRRPQGVPNEIK